MRLLWTYSNYPVSPLIKWLSNSQSSHFSIEFFGTFVLHSNFKGIGLVRSFEFFKHNTVVYEKFVPLSPTYQTQLFIEILKNYWGSRYDWKWFFSLFILCLLYKILLMPLPSHVVYQSRSRYLCTECANFLEKVFGPINIGNGLPDKLWDELKEREPISVL